MDTWVIDQWEAARADFPDNVLVKGRAHPSVMRVLPELLDTPGDQQGFLLAQVELLMRHLEIRKQDALQNWDGQYPEKIHAGMLLATSGQLAKLSIKTDDVRYLNTALKILDWMSNCRNSGTDWKKSLYAYASAACEEALAVWSRAS